MQAAGRPQRADLGRGRRARRLRHPALQGGRRQRGRRRLLRREGRAGQAARRGRLHQPQRVRRDDADGRRTSPDREAEKARFKESRGFAKRVKEILGDAPDIVFEHVGQATFPTSVFVVKPFGKVVICGATSGYTLDFDVRYLWMKQKQIIGSHFANAYECMRANQLMAEGKIQPGALAGDGLRRRRRGAPAAAREQAPRQDLDPRRRRPTRRRASTRRARARSGPRSAPDDATGTAHWRSSTSTGTSTRSGPTAGYEIWEPAPTARCAFGAKGWSLTRTIDDPLHFRQASIWESRDDFERYWFSDEIAALREAGAQLLQQARPPRLARADRRGVGSASQVSYFAISVVFLVLAR